MEKENEIRYVTRSKLRPFRYHPYLVREDEEMANLVNSIKENGVIEPLIVRKITSKQYESLSGHRRFKACQILGLSDIPIIIKDIKMPEAAIFVVDSNLQRENLLPSEKAFGLVTLYWTVFKRTFKIENKKRGNLKWQETEETILMNLNSKWLNYTTAKNQEQSWLVNMN